MEMDSKMADKKFLHKIEKDMKGENSEPKIEIKEKKYDAEV